MSRKPVLVGVPTAARKPNPEQVPERRRWAFSFRYWKQIENFGVGGKNASWFVSLLERLGELSGSTVSDVTDNPAVKTSLRIHDIDWVWKNIPVDRSDINWVDRIYWDNPAEFPLFQFHISKALGRVAGFLDENQVFNIVLLDPMHNLQPSSYSQYKVRATNVGECQLTALVARVEKIVLNHSELSDDGRREVLNILREKMQVDGRAILLLPVDQRVIDAVDALIALGTHSDPGEYLMAVIDEAFAKL